MGRRGKEVVWRSVRILSERYCMNWKAHAYSIHTCAEQQNVSAASNNLFIHQLDYNRSTTDHTSRTVDTPTRMKHGPRSDIGCS